MVDIVLDTSYHSFTKFSVEEMETLLRKTKRIEDNQVIINTQWGDNTQFLLVAKKINCYADKTNLL